MMDAIIAIVLVMYFVAGRCVAVIVDTEDILLDTLVMLFWPMVVILAFFTFIFWG